AHLDHLAQLPEEVVHRHPLQGFDRVLPVGAIGKAVRLPVEDVADLQLRGLLLGHRPTVRVGLVPRNRPMSATSRSMPARSPGVRGRNGSTSTRWPARSRRYAHVPITRPSASTAGLISPPPALTRRACSG